MPSYYFNSSDYLKLNHQLNYWIKLLILIIKKYELLKSISYVFVIFCDNNWNCAETCLISVLKFFETNRKKNYLKFFPVIM